MTPTVFRRMQSNWGRRAHGDFTDHCFYENGFCVHCDHFFSGEKFVEFLQSEEALKVFESYGFQKNAE